MEEKEYLRNKSLSDNFYEIKRWPESQEYISHPESILIEDVYTFGGSAYIVPKNISKEELNWYNEFEFNPKEEMILTWPESQEYMGHPDAELINDELGLELFGGSAYRLPINAEPIIEEEE